MTETKDSEREDDDGAEPSESALAIGSLDHLTRRFLAAGATLEAELTLNLLLRIGGRHAWDTTRELLPEMPPVSNPDLARGIVDGAARQPGDPFDEWLGLVDWSQLSWSPHREQLDTLLDRLWRDYSRDEPREPKRWISAVSEIESLARMGDATLDVEAVFARYANTVPREPNDFEARDADYALLGLLAEHNLASPEDAASIMLRSLAATLRTVMSDHPYREEARSHILGQLFPAVDAAYQSDVDELENALGEADGLDDLERDAITLAMFAKRRSERPALRSPMKPERIAQLASDTSGAQAAGRWLATVRPSPEQAWPVIRAALLARQERRIKDDLIAYMGRLSERRRATLVESTGQLYVDRRVGESAMRAVVSESPISNSTSVAIVGGVYETATNNAARKRALMLARELGIDDPAAQARLLDRVFNPALRLGKGAAKDAIRSLDLIGKLDGKSAAKRDRAVARAKKTFGL